MQPKVSDLNEKTLVNRKIPQIDYKHTNLPQTNKLLEIFGGSRSPRGRGNFWRAAKRIMGKLQEHTGTWDAKAEWERKRVRRFYPSYDLLHRDCSGKSQQVASTQLSLGVRHAFLRDDPKERLRVRLPDKRTLDNSVRSGGLLKWCLGHFLEVIL